MRELQQHVEEEEAGAIKWGDKMVRGDEDIKYKKLLHRSTVSASKRESWRWSWRSREGDWQMPASPTEKLSEVRNGKERESFYLF